MHTSLTGSWALVLGVSSGMGRAAALGLARAGVNIAGVHFDTASAQDSVDSLHGELSALGVKVEFFNVNAASAVTRRELVPQLVELTGEKGIRILLHSLAFGSLVPFVAAEDGGEQLSTKQMDMTLNVMANSLVYWVQDVVAAGLLRSGAKVFAMTSAGDVRVSPNYGAVSAAKSALQAHVRQLAVELAPRGIAVNALRAGVTLTPSLLRIPEHGEIVARAEGFNPHGRLTTPEDVAEAITLLSLAPSSWITGNVIGVDGGEVLTT